DFSCGSKRAIVAAGKIYVYSEHSGLHDFWWNVTSWHLSSGADEAPFALGLQAGFRRLGFPRSLFRDIAEANGALAGSVQQPAFSRDNFSGRYAKLVGRCGNQHLACSSSHLADEGMIRAD